jgi:predicted Zn-dependent peptidase
MDDHYGAKQMVLSAAGNIQHDQLVTLATDYFTDLKMDCHKDVSPAAFKGGEFRQSREQLEQTHIVLGFEGVPYGHPHYYAATLLSTILGGGMSSRLFQEIREKRGLVYSIYAFHSSYKDTGMFGIYAGTGPEKARELLNATADLLKQFPGTIIDQELLRAKAQLKASLMMGLESTSSRCEQLAQHMHIYGRRLSPKEILEKIESVSPKQVIDLATSFFSSPLTLATLGPIDDVPSKDEIEKAFL